MKPGGVKLRRDQSVFGSIDYLLMGFGNCLAVYSAGMAVGAGSSGQVFCLLVGVGTLISLLLRHVFRNRSFLNADSLLYTCASIAGVLLTPVLNSVLPGDGIPSDVTTTGWLCWMLAFGSFFAWRDRTLLFQAVPTIALFGLIGCYDTYAPAPFLFFGFLLCLATLLGRSHSREMLRLAVLSGYFNRADSPLTVTEHPERSPELYEDIKKGPWRWLAGPEWALLSGLAIVFFSLLGAPVIRQAVQPISGVMHDLGPRRIRSNLFQRPSQSSSSYEVGRGPLTNPNSPPIALYMAQLDRVRYFRTGVYDIYTGKGWTTDVAAKEAPSASGIGSVAIGEMQARKPFTVQIQLMTQSNLVPLPAETTAVVPDGMRGARNSVQLRADGAAYTFNPMEKVFLINALESSVAPRDAEREAGRFPPRCLDKEHITDAVTRFALAAAGSAKTDYGRADAIRTAIATQCKYYKAASAVPADQDAAEYFLFGSKQGYCDLFATAMAVSARAAGIPAHFCIGYLPDLQGTGTGMASPLYDRDYHAWAELYFKGVGWVVFDATAGAESLDAVRSHNGNIDWSASITNLLNVLIAISALTVAGVGLRSLLRRRPKPAGTRTEVERFYSRFTKMLARFSGQPRRSNETPDEYIARVQLPSGEVGAKGLKLNGALTEALYGPEEADEDQLARFRTQLKEMEVLLNVARKSASRAMGAR